MYVILAPGHRYFVDWNEETPLWDALPCAYQFTAKEEALELMRLHIARDQEEKRAPCFAGCRVASFGGERTRLVLRTLREKGFHATLNEECTAIWIDFDHKKIAIAKAIATFPRDVYGLPVYLRANGRAIKWDHKGT